MEGALKKFLNQSVRLNFSRNLGKGSRVLAFSSMILLSACQTIDFPTIENSNVSLGNVSLSEYLPQDLNAKHDLLAKDCILNLEKGNFDEALEAINRALVLRPDKSYLNLLAGLTYHMRALEGSVSDFDLAIEGYNLAVKFDSSNWIANYFKGLAHIERREFEEAQQSLAKVLDMNPRDPEVLSAFVKASYYAGRPEDAAGGIEALEDIDALEEKNRLNNAVMVMSALGEEEKKKAYFQRFKNIEGVKDRELNYLESRMHQWKETHKQVQNKGGIIKAQFGSPGSMGSSGGFGGGSSFGGSGGSQFGGSTFGSGNNSNSGFGSQNGQNSDGNQDKMVVVDVVIIRTEETLSTSRGINLLNSLQLQWGSSNSSTAGYSFKKSSSKNIGNATRAITQALTIPAITYSLNIANSNSVRNEILARPTLVAVSGKKSVFFSGTDLNASAVATGSQGGQSVQVNKEIGVKLEISPSFTPDGRINMNVVAERTFINSPDSNVNYTFIIETSKTQVDANVSMRYGETLILSGLSEKEDANTRDGVPLLQDIPGVQYLFSSQSKENFQKSVLILVTPRPAQYIYQPENARKEFEESLNEDERPLANLRSRYSDWFKPYPNWASAFNHMQGNSLYRDFRTGDVDLEDWSDTRFLKDRLKQIIDFLYY